MLKQELETVLQRAEDMGVDKMVTVGTAPDDWGDYQILNMKYPEKIYYSAGLHPGYVGADWKEKLVGLINLWKSGHPPVALGEIGLDYFRLPNDPEKSESIISCQKEAFRKQLLWAKEINCPVIIHSRSAFDDCVSEIDRSGVQWGKVVFHCFTEGVQQISQLVERGGRASFTGIVTFPKNENLLEAVKYQGLDKLMIETDSPYLAPVPYRGKKNQPAYLPEVGNFLGQFLSSEIESKSWENAQNFYQI